MRAALLGLAVVLAGCVTPAALPGADDAPALPGFVGTVLALADCTCWEPSVAIDSRGTIYVAPADTARIAVSTDGGRTFVERATPPIPASHVGADIADGYVAVAPDDSLHYIAFLGFLFPVAAVPTGLHLARSTDGGATWDANTVLSLAADREKNVVSPWKSWIGFGNGGKDVYVTYNQRGGLVMVGKSEDGGKTWGAFQRVNEGDVAVSNFPSSPVVDREGRVAIAYFGDQSPSKTSNPYFFEGHTLYVALSDDAGKTYRTVVARAAGPVEFVGSSFPQIAVDDAGRWHMAYWDSGMRIALMTSLDRGETWSDPVVWSDGSDTGAGPWLLASHGELLVAWQAAGPAVKWAKGPAKDRPAPLTWGKAADAWQGDYAHVARTSDGRLVVPYGGEAGLEVTISRIP